MRRARGASALQAVINIFAYDGVEQCLFAVGIANGLGVPGKVKGLRDNESKGQAEYAEQFEVYPGIGIEIIDNVKIEKAHGDEKGRPTQVQMTPSRGGQDNIFPHHALCDGLFADELTTEKAQAEQPV